MDDQKPRIPGLRQIDNMADFLAKKPLETELGICVRARYRQFACVKCVDVCEVGAISFTNEPRELPAIDFAICNGCGACVTACPTGVFDYVGGLTDSDLLRKEAFSARAAADGELYFACGRVREELRTRAIEVACLARLHETLLVGAAKFGVTKAVLVSSGCSDCALRQADFIAGRVAAAAGLVKALGFKTTFTIVDEADMPNISGEAALIEKEQPTRRELLEGMAGFLRKTGASWAEEKLAPLLRIDRQVRKDKGFVYLVPHKRQLLQGLLRDVKIRGRASFPDLPIRAVDFDRDKCNLCGDCALFCPTGAAALEKHDDGDHLVFYSGHCVDCGLCAYACRPGALRLADTVDLADFCQGVGRALKSAQLRLECVICSDQFAGDRPIAVCPTCYELQKLQGYTDEDIAIMEPITIESEAL